MTRHEKSVPSPVFDISLAPALFRLDICPTDMVVGIRYDHAMGELRIHPLPFIRVTVITSWRRVAEEELRPKKKTKQQLPYPDTGDAQ